MGLHDIEAHRLGIRQPQAVRSQEPGLAVRKQVNLPRHGFSGRQEHPRGGFQADSEPGAPETGVKLLQAGGLPGLRLARGAPGTVQIGIVLIRGQDAETVSRIHPAQNLLQPAGQKRKGGPAIIDKAGAGRGIEDEHRRGREVVRGSAAEKPAYQGPRRNQYQEDDNKRAQDEQEPLAGPQLSDVAALHLPQQHQRAEIPPLRPVTAQEMDDQRHRRGCQSQQKHGIEKIYHSGESPVDE